MVWKRSEKGRLWHGRRMRRKAMTWEEWGEGSDMGKE